jgi:hypothetical protein
MSGSGSQWARSGLAESVKVLSDLGGVVAMITEASEASRYRVVVLMIEETPSLTASV